MGFQHGEMVVPFVGWVLALFFDEFWALPNMA